MVMQRLLPISQPVLQTVPVYPPVKLTRATSKSTLIQRPLMGFLPLPLAVPVIQDKIEGAKQRGAHNLESIKMTSSSSSALCITLYHHSNIKKS